MECLTFVPILKRIRWGGRALGEVLRKPIGPESDYAESWEIADHEAGRSVVASGTFHGLTLPQLLDRCGPRLLGRELFQRLQDQGAEELQFPLLIKFLDAHDWLSLQVHPNDEQAVSFHPMENGKTEAWVILQADAGSEVCCGLKAGVLGEQLRAATETGDLSECLHRFQVKAGDCLFVPAGTVHALGPGILLAEVQQQSNLTFRLHDWGRVGADGKPRELHLESAFAVTDYERGPVGPVTPVPLAEGTHPFDELVRCEHFVIRRHQGVNAFEIHTQDRFRILVVTDGDCTIRGAVDPQPISRRRGETLLVPAVTEKVRVEPDGEATVLEITVP